VGKRGRNFRHAKKEGKRVAQTVPRESQKKIMTRKSVHGENKKGWGSDKKKKKGDKERKKKKRKRERRRGQHVRKK